MLTQYGRELLHLAAVEQLVDLHRLQSRHHPRLLW